MRLLPGYALIKTSAVDYADWNFRPLLGFIQRMRFKLVIRLLPKHRMSRLLEIGYGSGVFLPELACHCKELYGFDIYPYQKRVTELLSGYNVSANLFSGNPTPLPFKERCFDCIVAVSTLEFIEDLDTVCTEIKRILKPNGLFIIVTPGYSFLTDLGLWILTGEKAKDSYANRRLSLIRILVRYFAIQQIVRIPALGSSIICLYRGLKLCNPVYIREDAS
jgi:ubiquinone/menaquinone biosynthesis C-methylase UbiE